MRKKLSKQEAIHKLHQLQKRLKRGDDNKGHTSRLKIRQRLKRLLELRKTISRYNK
jgi:hypothetical protein